MIETEFERIDKKLDKICERLHELEKHVYAIELMLRIKPLNNDTGNEHRNSPRNREELKESNNDD